MLAWNTITILVHAFLCNYSHHDASAIINRPIGIEVRPLDEKGTRKITNLIADLILKASISVHKFLKTDQVDVFEDLQQKWQAMLRDTPFE